MDGSNNIHVKLWSPFHWRLVGIVAGTTAREWPLTKLTTLQRWRMLLIICYITQSHSPSA